MSKAPIQKLLPRLLIPVILLLYYSFPSTTVTTTHILPPDLTYAKPSAPIGTLLFLPGCSHRSIHYFPPSPTCPHCIGLPTLKSLVDIALSHHYIPLALTASSPSYCWTASPADIASINTAFKLIPPVQPLFIVAISSAAKVATSIPSAGILSIISSVQCIPHAPRKPYAFVHMERDKHLTRSVQNARDCLEQLGNPTVAYSVGPRRIMQANFTDIGVPNPIAADVFNALRAAGFINSDGWLVSDPRRSEWRKPISNFRKQLNDSLQPDRSAISELLNRAWGFHEATSEHFDNALHFLERMSQS